MTHFLIGLTLQHTLKVFSLFGCFRFNGGLVFGVVAMVGSVVLLIKTLQQTFAQMTTDNPRIGGQQALQVVVSKKTW